jgi:RHS repeat-associated protein
VTTRTSSAVGNPITFTGRRLDAETGLMYYRARMYSIELGRFVGRDPIGAVENVVGVGVLSALVRSVLGVSAKAHRPTTSRDMREPVLTTLRSWRVVRSAAGSWGRVVRALLVEHRLSNIYESAYPTPGTDAAGLFVECGKPNVIVLPIDPPAGVQFPSPDEYDSETLTAVTVFINRCDKDENHKKCEKSSKSDVCFLYKEPRDRCVYAACICVCNPYNPADDSPRPTDPMVGWVKVCDYSSESYLAVTIQHTFWTPESGLAEPPEMQFPDEPTPLDWNPGQPMQQVTPFGPPGP